MPSAHQPPRRSTRHHARQLSCVIACAPSQRLAWKHQQENKQNKNTTVEDCEAVRPSLLRLRQGRMRALSAVHEMIPSTSTNPGTDNHTEKVAAASAAVPACKPMTATKSAPVISVNCPHQKEGALGSIHGAWRSSQSVCGCSSPTAMMTISLLGSSQGDPQRHSQSKCQAASETLQRHAQCSLGLKITLCLASQ